MDRDFISTQQTANLMAMHWKNCYSQSGFDILADFINT